MTAPTLSLEIFNRLLDLERQLFEAERFAIVAPGRSCQDVPEANGVYAVWRRGTKEIIHIGESSNLNHRISDFAHPTKHKVGRILKEELNSMVAGAEKFSVSWIQFPLGRRELEDFLNVRWLKKKIARLPEKHRHEIESLPQLPGHL